MSGMTRMRNQLFGAAIIAICGTLSLSMMSEAPLFLYPITPSLPPGLYVRTFGPPEVGMIAAFRVPEAAKRYKASIGEDVHDDFLFMKPIIAGPGDYVCQPPERFDVIRGKMARIVIPNDTNRRQPPLWPICRLLTNDEFFMMSLHLPNSFDSRYFGPIRRSQILGSYRSLSFGQSRLCA